MTTVTIEEKDNGSVLTQEFEGIPQTFFGKLMMGLMGGFMKKATEKAMQEDLVDIKQYIERQIK